MIRRQFLLGAATAVGGLSIETGIAPARAMTADSSSASAMSLAEFIATRRSVDLAFGRIAYTDMGRGEAALFLHGFPLNGFQWRGVIERVASHRRCIAPDMLGLGYTEPAQGQSLAPDAQVNMLIALLDHLKVQSVDLVGNDSGGAVVQLFAVRHPERVRSMLFTNCDVAIDSPPAALRPILELARAGKFGSEFLRNSYEDKQMTRSEKGLGGACYVFRANPTDEMIEAYLGPLSRDPQRAALSDAYALALEENPLAGVEARLRDLRIPARLLWGDADTIFPLRDGEYLAGILAKSQGIRRVEGGKLFFPEEFPDLVAAEAKRLWRIS
jgi:haloalkane dehalogenase